MSEATAQESVNDAACKMFPRVFLISDRIARLDPRRIRVALIERRRTEELASVIAFRFRPGVSSNRP